MPTKFIAHFASGSVKRTSQHRVYTHAWRVQLHTTDAGKLVKAGFAGSQYLAERAACSYARSFSAVWKVDSVEVVAVAKVDRKVKGEINKLFF